VTSRHHARVYGKVASGSPPISVPHLDTRVVSGKTSLLFGPYAGFSGKFLKHGSLTDLFHSITPDNVIPLLNVAQVGGAFTSTASRHGGQETTRFSIITSLMHHGITIVGLDYGFQAQVGLDRVRGGSPNGATTIADGDGSRQPAPDELDGARYQGRRIAETAARLK
jgi:hypothetical protein